MSLFKAPKVNAEAPIKDTTEDKAKARRARALLVKTQGGVTGEDLQVGQVAGDTRPNIFGN
jgi:hypothetical protein